MRLIVVIFLAGLVALMALPQIGMAGGAAHGPDCMTCPKDMPGHGGPDDLALPSCTKMGICTLALIPVAPAVSRRAELVPARHVPPAATPIRTIAIPCDLPPPRA